MPLPDPIPLKIQSPISRLLLFIASLIACHLMPAAVPAEGSIEGRVLNVRTGGYLGNARVTLGDGTLEAFTDADGRFRFPRVPAGSVEVRAVFTGLTPGRATASVRAGEVVTLELALEQGPAGSGTVRLSEFIVGASREMAGDQ